MPVAHIVALDATPVIDRLTAQLLSTRRDPTSPRRHATTT
jgi:hypothetical protein